MRVDQLLGHLQGGLGDPLLRRPCALDLWQCLLDSDQEPAHRLARAPEVVFERLDCDARSTALLVSCSSLAIPSHRFRTRCASSFYHSRPDRPPLCMGTFHAIRCSLADTAGVGAALRTINATASQQATAPVEDTYRGDGWTELAQVARFPNFKGMTLVDETTRSGRHSCRQARGRPPLRVAGATGARRGSLVAGMYSQGPARRAQPGRRFRRRVPIVATETSYRGITDWIDT